jgi:hypothetical protein
MQLMRYRTMAVALSASVFYMSVAVAGPSAPSARVAARLASKPPNNYLKHYLPDDRYILAGGIWKVVSTQTDKYYHRPTCPNMLRQRADLVIGFHAPAAAEEAGYMPDPYCSPEERKSIQIGGSEIFLGSTTINTGSKSIRLTLADGKSTVLLPPGWARTASIAYKKTDLNIDYTLDTFQPIRGKSGLIKIMTAYTTEFDISSQFSAGKFPAFIQSTANNLDSRSGQVSNTTSAITGGSRGIKGFYAKRTARNIKWGGFKAVEMASSTEGNRLVFAGRHFKNYIFGERGQTGPGGRVLFNSFRGE